MVKLKVLIEYTWLLATHRHSWCHSSLIFYWINEISNKKWFLTERKPIKCVDVILQFDVMGVTWRHLLLRGSPTKSYTVLENEPYISCPYWCRSLFIPVGSIVCSRHIQRSSWNSRSASVDRPVCRIKIFISFSGLWSLLLKKCWAKAQFPGLFRQSYLCLDILACNVSPVCPT